MDDTSQSFVSSKLLEQLQAPASEVRRSSSVHPSILLPPFILRSCHFYRHSHLLGLSDLSHGQTPPRTSSTVCFPSLHPHAPPPPPPHVSLLLNSANEKCLPLSQKSQKTRVPQISEAWLWLIIPGEEQRAPSFQRVGGGGGWNPAAAVEVCYISLQQPLHSVAAAAAAAALCIA